MSQLFRVEGTRHCVGHFSTVAATQFVEITGVIARSMSRSTCIAQSPERNPDTTDLVWGVYDTTQEYLVEGESFCRLVEHQMVMPRRLFYGWATYAAAMYELIKGRRYRWQWVEQGELLPFEPIYVGVLPSTESCDELIGLE